MPTGRIYSGMLLVPRSSLVTRMIIVLLLSSAETSHCFSIASGTRIDRSTGRRHDGGLPFRVLLNLISYSNIASPVLSQSSSLSNDNGEDNETDVNDDISTPAAIPSQQQQQQQQRAAPPQPKQLDPLFMAVTKMDPQTQRAESISIPIWGELILDKSLFVLLPIALFAIGGIFLSLYVLINSSDTFVNAVVDTAMKQSIPTSVPDSSSDSCRGLCSSQAQDLEGLRSYMNRFNGR